MCVETAAHREFEPLVLGGIFAAARRVGVRCICFVSVVRNQFHGEKKTGRRCDAKGITFEAFDAPDEF